MTLYDTGHRSITGTVDDVARWITSASYGLIHRARAGTACNIPNHKSFPWGRSRAMMNC